MWVSTNSCAEPIFLCHASRFYTVFGNVCSQVVPTLGEGRVRALAKRGVVGSYHFRPFQGSPDNRSMMALWTRLYAAVGSYDAVLV